MSYEQLNEFAIDNKDVAKSSLNVNRLNYNDHNPLICIFQELFYLYKHHGIGKINVD